MRFGIGAALAVALWVLAPWGAALAAPLEAYGQLPSIESAAVSASGSQLALVTTSGDERRIVIKDIAQDKITFVGTVGTSKVRDIKWAGDQHLIITSSVTGKPLDVSADRSEWFFASDLDLGQKKLRQLLRDSPGTTSAITTLPEVRIVDGKPVVLLQAIHFETSVGLVSLFRIDVERSASSVMVEEGVQDTLEYVVGPNGYALGQSLYDPHTNRWKLWIWSDGEWRSILSEPTPIDIPDLLGLGRRSGTVLVATSGKDRQGWREIAVKDAADLSTGQAAATPIHDPATGRLIGYTGLAGDEGRYVFFDPADDAAWKAVVRAFGGDRVRLVSWSADRKKILVRVDSATLGPAYALVDLTSGKASWQGNEYDGLKDGDIGPVTPVRFKAADGLELTGYLTLPHGKTAKNLPLIVFPHGGPAARDEPGFDWWAQGMASRGYAVLQVNFRGSDGFGWDFMQAGFGQWGRKMQSDLSDGVRYLAEQGTIDPKRVCIVGASYGGYAALAGAVLQSGLYRCAVSFGGVSDLKRMVAYDRGRGGKVALRYWTRYMGAEDLGDPVLAAYSPALHAEQASAPILLIHGKDDTVVPLNQSTGMADALKKAGKPVEIIVQNNADHWLSLGATRLEMLKATMAFVEKNNPPN